MSPWKTTERWHNGFEIEIQSGKMDPFGSDNFWAKPVRVHRGSTGTEAATGWPIYECHGETEDVTIEKAFTAVQNWIDQLGINLTHDA